MVDLARLSIFLVFITLGVRAGVKRTRRTVDHLLVFSLVISFAVGVVQIESWPFSNWALVWARAPSTAISWELTALDEAGVEYRVDPRVLQPLANEDFGNWLLGTFEKASEQEKNEVAAHVLERAEHGREQFLRSGRVGSDSRWLGPLAAPRHFVPAPDWTGPNSVPDSRFVTLRFFRLEWDVARRAGDSSALKRVLLHEYDG